MPDFIGIWQVTESTFEKLLSFGPRKEPLDIESVGPSSDFVLGCVVSFDAIGSHEAVELDGAKVSDFFHFGLLSILI